MKTFFGLLLLPLAISCFADQSHFSSETQILIIPSVVIDGTDYFENVMLELDIASGRFNVLGGTEAEFPAGPQQIQLDFEETKLLLDASMLSFIAIESDSRCPPVCNLYHRRIR